MLSQVLEDIQTVHTYCSTRPRPRAKIDNELLRVHCALQDLLESTRALLDAGDSEILRRISADTLMKYVSDLDELSIRLRRFSKALGPSELVPSFRYDPSCLVNAAGEGILVTLWHLACTKDCTDWATHIERRIAKRVTLQVAVLKGQWRSSQLRNVFLSALMSKQHGMAIPSIILHAPKGDTDAAEKHYAALAACGQLLKGLLVERFDCEEYL